MTASPAQQYPLSFNWQPTYTPEDYLPLSNHAVALQGLQQLPSVDTWGALIIGAKGTGKTHLLHYWAAQQQAEVLRPEVVTSELTQEILVVDDLCCMNRAEQEQLFHHFNRLQTQTGERALVIATGKELTEFDLLPDLRTRLQTLPTYRLSLPTASELELLLPKWAADRQLSLAPAVLDYLLNHVERDPGILQQLIVVLDEAALATGRKPGVPLLKEILAKAGPQ